MIEWAINYMKWWCIFVLLFLLISIICTIIIWYKNHVEGIPDSITIRCGKCGGVHELKVIKLLSKKITRCGTIDGKYTMYTEVKYKLWCNRLHKFDTLYQMFIH